MQLTNLSLTGQSKNLGDSNIVPNALTFDFLAFKSLTTLILIDMEINKDKIGTFALLRNTLINFEATRCGLKCISDLLLCDSYQPTYSNEIEQFESSSNAHLENETNLASNSNYMWKSLQYLNLRENNITVIDQSVTTAPLLKTLLLGTNSIKAIENLDSLSNLAVLELPDNNLEIIDGLHMKLGQLTRLDLGNNKIRSLAGCSKLYSLVNLNVPGNKINDMDNVFPVSNLPCLESLNLQGNHVTTVVDYRLKVFEAFGKRCSDLCLGKSILND